jgi:hypothetical protein
MAKKRKIAKKARGRIVRTKKSKRRTTDLRTARQRRVKPAAGGDFFESLLKIFAPSPAPRKK